MADVMKGSPAEGAGLKPGDVVVEFGGAPIKETPDLQQRVARVTPGQTIRMTIVRDGKPVPVTVKVGEMPGEEPAPAAAEGVEGFGLQVEPLGADEARRLNLPFLQGLLVTGVATGSPAERAGLRGGDVILEVNRQAVVDGKSLARALSAVEPGGSALLYVHRGGGGGNQYLVLERAGR